MKNEIPTRHEHKQGCEMVGNEEIVSRDENKVVKEIDAEIRDAEIKN